jgi:hypothetical protein
MVVHHLVAPERLEKQYFRRWMYWHGISRAMLFRQSGFDMEEPELEYPPHAGERQFFGVPPHLIGKALRSMCSLAWQTVKGNAGVAFDHELWLCFFAGIVRQRWADRHLSTAAGPAVPTRVADPDAQPDAALV